VKEPDVAFSEAMKQWTGLLKEESEREPKAPVVDVSGAASEYPRTGGRCLADCLLGQSKGKPARGEEEVMKQTSQRELAVDREKHANIGSDAIGAAPSAGSPVSATFC
jgi:hypothetical protein